MAHPMENFRRMKRWVCFRFDESGHKEPVSAVDGYRVGSDEKYAHRWSASGGSDGGTTTSSSASGGAYVQPTCWYEPGQTGREMVAEMRADGLAWKGLFLPDEEAALAHADDDKGRWYQTNCDTSTEEGRERMAKMITSSLRWVWTA